MKKYRCKICDYIYDDAKEEVKFENLPDSWICPLCGAPKNLFEEIKEEHENIKNNAVEKEDTHEDLRELSDEEVAYICLNLAKGCEKQYLEEEQNLFKEIANSYLKKISTKEGSLNDVKNLIKQDTSLLENAMATANQYQDRGAKRVINWASKTTNLISSILERYEKEGTDFIKKNKIWVCDICGFIYIGEKAPETCPICKVPSFKILEVE